MGFFKNNVKGVLEFMGWLKCVSLRSKSPYLLLKFKKKNHIFTAFLFINLMYYINKN